MLTPELRAIVVGSLLLACGTDEGSLAMEPSAVLAISADKPLAGRIDRLAVTLTVAGVPEDRQEMAAILPVEVALARLPAQTPISATVEAFDATGALLVRRTIATNAVDQRTLLLRARLQDECVIAEAEHDVSCVGLTCQAGTCAIPHVGAHRLEDYVPTWNEPVAGTCGLAGDDEPEVDIGKPEPPFEPFMDGETVVPQQGLQGASHFFLSVRMRGADPTTARTVTQGTVLSTARETNAVTIGDPYDADCSLYMIPFILPPEGVVEELMRLDVTVFDHTENAGHGHVVLHLAEPLPP